MVRAAVAYPLHLPYIAVQAPGNARSAAHVACRDGPDRLNPVAGEISAPEAITIWASNAIGHSSMALDDLPQELLAHIFTFLHIAPHSPAFAPGNAVKLNTLAAAAAASRALNAAASPTLYHTFHIGNHAMARMWQFGTTIMGNSRLASMVRVLHFPDDQDDYNSTSGRDAFDACCAARGLPYHISPSGNLTTGENDRDFRLPLIIGSCPRLVQLSVPRPWSHRTHAEMRSRKLHELVVESDWIAAPCLPGALQTLRELRLYAPIDMNLTAISISQHEIEKALSLPSLRTLRVQHPASSARSPLCSSSTLRHLYLTESQTRAIHIARLLKTFPELRTLSIDCTNRAFSFAREFAAIGDVLRSQGTALTKLALGSRNYNDTEASPPLIGSLVELASLQSLRLPIEALISNDDGTSDDASTDQPMLPLAANLPPTLRYLTVIDDFNANNDAHLLDAALIDLIANTSFSKLKRIRVHRRALFSEQLEHLGWQSSHEDELCVLRRCRGG